MGAEGSPQEAPDRARARRPVSGSSLPADRSARRPTRFLALADLCDRLKTVSRRKELVGLVADFLGSLPTAEVPAAVSLLLGLAHPGEAEQLNLSAHAFMAAVRGLAPAPAEAYSAAFAQNEDFGGAVRAIWERWGPRPTADPLGLLEVAQAFAELARASGEGSRESKQAVLRALLGRACPSEVEWLAKNVIGEMRHGVSEGLLVEAIALAAGASPAQVRRAGMLVGDVRRLAQVALTQGPAGLAGLGVSLFTPLKPMLAAISPSPGEALAAHRGRTAFEHKLDGARVQIHRAAARVEIFSRQLARVTASLPEIARAVAEEAAAQEAIFEGEVVAVGPAGRPLPFQELMRRFRRLREIPRAQREVQLQLYLFDLLYANGEPLTDLPYAERWRRLVMAAGGLRPVERMVTDGVGAADAFLARALEAGHEGLMAKRLDAPYTPGVRGKAWLKIKAAHTADLVIVAADWGYGRRRGWLSNYHLAARDETSGELELVGKTFKGLTDEEFQEMTIRLLGLKRAQHGGTVQVRPQVVVEVAFGNVQRSPRYRSGLALRFARILRLREDKAPQEVDTVQGLRALLPSE